VRGCISAAAKHGANVLTAIHDALAGHPGCCPSLTRRKAMPSLAGSCAPAGIAGCGGGDAVDRIFAMPAFSAHDGTGLAYHVLGKGIPVICLPGGPMQDSVYLGDLGGPSAHRQLIMVDPRGDRPVGDTAGCRLLPL
jgi:hypothetical protein